MGMMGDWMMGGWGDWGMDWGMMDMMACSPERISHSLSPTLIEPRRHDGFLASQCLLRE